MTPFKKIFAISTKDSKCHVNSVKIWDEKMVAIEIDLKSSNFLFLFFDSERCSSWERYSLPMLGVQVMNGNSRER